MNRFLNFKALILLAVALFFNALALNAQRSDGLFRILENDDYNNRDQSIYGNGIVNQGVGEPAPLGSGLAVLAVAGAGYLAMRRKRNGSAMLLACLMFLGLTQCKKNAGVLNDVVSDGEEITLDVDGGSKANVNPTGHTNPNYATVAYEDGDTIFVGYNGQYVGYLVYTASESRFKGKINITEPDTDKPLHFYYLGGKGYKSTGVQNNSVSIDISDQGVIDVADDVHRYPIISYAASNENYPTGNSRYSARLLNKCAMVKFNVVKPAGYDKAGTCIMGMNNLVTVNFDTKSNEDDGFTYNQVNGGAITIDSKIGEVWAVLLPQVAKEEGGDMSVFSGRRKGVRPALDEIKANDYIETAYELNLNTEFAPTGVVADKANALFKVGENKYVLFSKANLKATTTDGWHSWTWGFKDTQYEKEITGDVGNDYANRSTVSLFGWASSGYYGSIQPNTTFMSTQGKFGPQANLTGSNVKYDWGYNRITNDAYNQWRCLTAAEWQYLANNNPHKDSKIKTDAGNVNGVVILPYGHTTSEIHSYSTGYTIDEWETAEETLGAIFMPNAGVRISGSIPFNTITISDQCDMWTSTYDDESTNHYANYAEFDYYGDLKIKSGSRARGFFVRLVCE